MTYRWRLILSFFLALLFFWFGISIVVSWKLIPDDPDLRTLILFIFPFIAGAWIPWIGWSKSPHNKKLEALSPLIL